MDLDKRQAWGVFGQTFLKDFQLQRAPTFSMVERKTWENLWKLRIQDRLELILWKIAVGGFEDSWVFGQNCPAG